MKTSNRRGLGRVLCRLVAVAAVSLTGCDDPNPSVLPEGPLSRLARKMGREYCVAAVTECGCETYPSVSSCQLRVYEPTFEFLQDGRNSGLTLDDTCFDDLSRHLADDPCAASDELSASECTPPCRAYHGELGIGEACFVDVGSLHECAQGLECKDDVCVDPCGPTESGRGPGQSCRDAPCQDELYCDATDGICRPHPDVGQPCEVAPCLTQLFCQLEDPNDPLTWRCAEPRPNASPCTGHFQCASNHCPAGYCEPMPGWGDVCPAGLCNQGLVCAGQCITAQPQLCNGPPAPLR